MAQNFVFRKILDGVLETFYPKTVTDNVVRKINGEEKKLDAILDEKGGFIPYTEKSADESTGNDLMFEIIGDVQTGETMKSIHGTVIGQTPPEDTKYIWVDSSADIAVLRCYDPETDTWKPINIGSEQVELDSDITD